MVSVVSVVSVMSESATLFASSSEPRDYKQVECVPCQVILKCLMCTNTLALDRLTSNINWTSGLLRVLSLELGTSLSEWIWMRFLRIGSLSSPELSRRDESNLSPPLLAVPLSWIAAELLCLFNLKETIDVIMVRF